MEETLSETSFWPKSESYEPISGSTAIQPDAISAGINQGSGACSRIHSSPALQCWSGRSSCAAAFGIASPWTSRPRRRPAKRSNSRLQIDLCERIRLCRGSGTEPIYGTGAVRARAAAFGAGQLCDMSSDSAFPRCRAAQSSCNPSLSMIAVHFCLSRVTRTDACAELFGANSSSAANIRSRTSGN